MATRRILSTRQFESRIVVESTVWNKLDSALSDERLLRNALLLELLVCSTSLEPFGSCPFERILLPVLEVLGRRTLLEL